MGQVHSKQQQLASSVALSTAALNSCNQLLNFFKRAHAVRSYQLLSSCLPYSCFPLFVIGFRRIMGQVHSKQQQLASSVALSTAASAPKPWGMRGGRSAATSAAAAAAATAPAQERDDLLHLLDEHMARW
jgi:hypothetical protein